MVGIECLRKISPICISEKLGYGTDIIKKCGHINSESGFDVFEKIVPYLY